MILDSAAENNRIQERIDNEPGTGGCTSDMLGLGKLSDEKGSTIGMAKDWSISKILIALLISVESRRRLEGWDAATVGRGAAVMETVAVTVAVREEETRTAVGCWIQRNYDEGEGTQRMSNSRTGVGRRERWGGRLRKGGRL